MSRRKRQPVTSGEVSTAPDFPIVEPNNRNTDTAPDLARVVEAEVAKQLTPEPPPARRCAYCGGWIEARGGHDYARGWACSHCTRHTGSDGSAGDVLDFAASALVGMANGHRRVGSGDLIDRAPELEPDDDGYYNATRWAHVDVADLRARWLARYGAVPQNESDRLRSAIVRKQQAAESARRMRAARTAKATRDMAKIQRRIKAMASTNGQAMVRR